MLIYIIKSSNKLKQSDISKIFKFIFKKQVVTDKKVIDNALIYYVHNGQYIIVDSLLKYGKANPNLETSSGYSILDVACDNYFIKMFSHYSLNTENNSLLFESGIYMFLIPYLNDFTLIGTTEVVLDYIEHPVTVSPEEIEYLCAITNQFVQRPISPSDIINQYAGIRPLQDDSRQQARKITRDYAIEIDDANLQAPVISIFGGKITTYRHLSENVGNMLGKYFSDCGPAWTKTAHLPGGDFINNDIEGFKRYLISVFPTLPSAVLNHYVDNYGMRAGEVLDKVHTIKDLGRHFGALLYQREVDYLVAQEWATCAEDILWRRGKMGLWFNAEQTKNLDDYLTKRHHTK